ncbi:hypothetical protein [Kitasatospora sp. NPDC094011]|uniref:hypothetical protein n=1 Tax=Kitasatospora sp. NPDC094011 TaxID=3364090 RepID=UPI00380D074F
MSLSSGPGSFNPNRRWRATYFFAGQPCIPAEDGLPAFGGTGDMSGTTAADSFEHLAVQLIAHATHRWWTPGVAPELSNFGTALLLHARRVTNQCGKWTYAPSTKQEWADVTVSYHPEVPLRQ